MIAVEQACNQLNLIWRNLLEEDVGVDGTIEVALGEFPTGKIVAAQVKSGMSYVRSETLEEFRFYPGSDDLAYWREISIPLFLLVHHPGDNCVYWVDVNRYFRSPTDASLEATYIIFSKTNKLDKGFESYLHDRFDLTVYSDHQYADLRQRLEAVCHADGSSGALGACLRISEGVSLLV